MAKISRQVKDILQIVVFLLVVGILIFFYAIYPLNRTKVAMGRPDLDQYNDDSLAVNDPTFYVDSGFVCDTFRVDADGLTSIAGIYIEANQDSATTPAGTVCLLHADGATRDSMLSLAQLFYDSGFAVIAYDQRASGRSTDKYRGEGGYEANDLQEVIRYLDLRGKIIHPFYAIGFQLGGDAALLTVQEEKRIEAIVSINPYLTTHRWLDIMKQKYDMMWFPFFRSIMWWWYNIRSSYAAPYRNIDNIRPITCPTVLAIPPETTDDPEIIRLKELSDGKPLIIHTLPESDLEIFSWIRELSSNPADTTGN